MTDSPYRLYARTSNLSQNRPAVRRHISPAVHSKSDDVLPAEMLAAQFQVTRKTAKPPPAGNETPTDWGDKANLQRFSRGRRFNASPPVSGAEPGKPAELPRSKVLPWATVARFPPQSAARNDVPPLSLSAVDALMRNRKPSNHRAAFGRTLREPQSARRRDQTKAEAPQCSPIRAKQCTSRPQSAPRFRRRDELAKSARDLAEYAGVGATLPPARSHKPTPRWPEKGIQHAYATSLRVRTMMAARGGGKSARRPLDRFDAGGRGSRSQTTLPRELPKPPQDATPSAPYLLPHGQYRVRAAGSRQFAQSVRRSGNGNLRRGVRQAAW